MGPSLFGFGLTFMVALTGPLIGQTDGATLFLQADDGSEAIDLAPGETANVSILLTIRDIDPGFAYANVFLNDDDDEADGELNVIGLIEGTGECHDHSGFELPADISHNGENEYGLVMGCKDGEDWGPGTYLLESLTIRHDGDSTSGTIEITFEISERSPEILTSDFEEYDLYCDWPPCSGYLELGVGGLANPFIVNLIPGPPCDGDANGDGLVDPLDSGFVLARFGCEVDTGDPDCDTADQNDDGEVDPLDVGYVAARFGTCE